MSVINSPRAHFSSNTGAIQASSGPCTPQRGIKYCSYKYNLRNEKNSKDDAPSGPHHDAQSDLIMQAQKRMIKKLKTLVCFGLVLMPIIIAFCMIVFFEQAFSTTSYEEALEEEREAYDWSIDVFFYLGLMANGWSLYYASNSRKLN